MPRQLLNIITRGDTVSCDCVSIRRARTQAPVKRLGATPICGASATGKPWHEQPYPRQEAVENKNRPTQKTTQMHPPNFAKKHIQHQHRETPHHFSFSERQIKGRIYEKLHSKQKACWSAANQKAQRDFGSINTLSAASDKINCCRWPQRKATVVIITSLKRDCCWITFGKTAQTKQRQNTSELNITAIK